VPMKIALEGRLAETSVLYGDQESLEKNKKVLEAVCTKSQRDTPADEKHPLGCLWKSVSPAIIIAAVQTFENHPECLLTYADPLVQYSEWLDSVCKARFDVLLRSVKDAEPYFDVADWTIVPVTRKVAALESSRIEFNKRRVASKGDERAGLTPEQVQ